MSMILAIDTAEKMCSVALYDNFVLLDFLENDEQNGHSKNLFILIDELLNKADLNVSQLEGVAFSSGPGSYTGLRIGCSAAKAIAYSSNIKMLALGSLEIVAEAYATEIRLKDDEIICVMMDARRMEVYWQFFNQSADSISDAKPAILTDDFEDLPSDYSSIHILGSAVLKARPVNLFSNASYKEKNYLHAKYMGPSIKRAYEQSNFADVAYFEPSYLKDFFFAKKIVGA